MFTGIVERTGIVEDFRARGPGARVRIATDLPELVLGESIAVSGVCLTVQQIHGHGFEADASAETLTCTTLGQTPLGARVHLERALTASSRLGGHLVTGHVDGKVRLAHSSQVGESLVLTFELCDPHLAKFIAKKGSVAVDGVSLTVNEVTRTTFQVAIIPHTQDVTTLAALPLRAHANLEVDLMARYVARILQTQGEEGQST